MTLVSSFLLGIAVSFVGWLMAAMVLRPRLTQPTLCRDLGDGHYLELRNRQLWQAVDICVMARLRVQGVQESRSRRWQTFNLPIDDPLVPILRGTLTSKREDTSRFRTILEGGARQRFEVAMDYLPDDIQQKLHSSRAHESGGRSHLESLLTLGTRSELYFVVFVSDGLSGTRTCFESLHYTREGIP